MADRSLLSLIRSGNPYQRSHTPLLLGRTLSLNFLSITGQPLATHPRFR